METTSVAPSRFLALRVLMGVFSVAAIGTMLWVVVNRIAYPYELGWLEGGMLHTVTRLVAGEPIYVPPTMEFAPYCYPPLYFMAARALVPVLGESFLALRAASFGAALICFALVGVNTWLHTRSRFWTFCSLGLFAGVYGIVGNWYDLARVDMVFLAALLGAITVLEFKPTARWQVVAALLILLAFLTKQSALMASIPLMLWTILFGKGRTRWIFPVLALTLMGGASLWLHWRTDGWSSFYIFDIPRTYQVWWSNMFTFWRVDIAFPSPGLLLGTLFVLYVTLRRESLRRSLWLLAVLASVISISWVSRMHWGGFSNVVLPFYAVGCVLFARAAWMLEQPEQLPDRLLGSRGVKLAVLAVMGLQAYQMRYDPRVKIGSEKEREAADAFVERLENVDGEIWLTTHGWIGPQVGSPWTTHQMAVMDVMRSENPTITEALWSEIQADVQARRWAMIITDDDYFKEVIETHYQAQGPVFAGDYELYPKNTPIRPSTIYLPKD